MLSDQEQAACRNLVRMLADLSCAANAAHGPTLETRNLDHAITEFLFALDSYRATYNQAEAEG